MATLHFDTDAGRMTAQTITASKGNMEAELANLRNRVNSMVGSEWISSAATQFQSEFETWANQLTQTMQALETLKTRLDQEIVEWETAAQGMA
ncbi:MAG: WXG100 family type VII secretion target [Caldilineaceae bacterium]